MSMRVCSAAHHFLACCQLLLHVGQEAVQVQFQSFWQRALVVFTIFIDVDRLHVVAHQLLGLQAVALVVLKLGVLQQQAFVQQQLATGFPSISC